MLASLRKRIEREDEGFTLIELMVVVLIIAILLAIAIPTFLGARERAQNRAAQSIVRNAYAAEKVFYTDDQAFTTDGPTMTKIEPSLTYTAFGGAPEAKNNEVALGVANLTSTPPVVAARVCVWTKAQTGNFYGVSEMAIGGAASVKYFKSEGSLAAAPTGCNDLAPAAVAQDIFTLAKW